MDCLAIMDSGNLALYLCRLMEQRGLIFEIMPTPCSIAKTGCGYCIRFPCEYTGLLVGTACENRLAVREIYKYTPGSPKHKFERVLKF